jgi:hypothetical protein
MVVGGIGTTVENLYSAKMTLSQFHFWLPNNLLEAKQLIKLIMLGKELLWQFFVF